MTVAVGLSVGATRCFGVQLGRPAVARPSTAEFVDRVGDPVGVLTADGSVNRGERLVADELRDVLYAATDGRPPVNTAAIAYPAHWRKTQVDALRWELMRLPEWSRSGEPVMLIPDTAAAITTLQADPGVPARGVIVLCDFGGTGTTISFLDASRGYAPIGPTVRHTDFSGELIDQALLAHVVTDVSAVGAVDATGTSALGPLHRLRAQCRDAKERLSSTAVTALTAHLPGFSGDVRLTRTELDDLIRRPLSDFVAVVDDSLNRAGIRPADVVAVASVGGGARIPLITTALSERFRVPVVTTPRPELASATGAAKRAAWGPADDRSTAIAPVPVAAAAAAPAFADADAQSSTFRALAWSEAHDVPPVAKPLEAPAHLSRARPQMEFEPVDEPAPVVTPWYRRGSTLAGVGTAAVLLLAASAVVAFGSDSPTMSTTAPHGPSTSSAAPAPAPADNPAQAQSQDPPRTVYVSPAPPAQSQAPITQYVAPAPQPAAAPPPAAPSSEPPAAPPPETQTVTSTVTQPPPSPQPPPDPPPQQDPPSTQPQSPPSNTQPPVTLTIPPIPQIPGLTPPHNR